MKEFFKGIYALLMTVLVCGSVLLGLGVGTWFFDVTSERYDYDLDYTYKDHEERVMILMGVGLAITSGATAGIGVLKSDTERVEVNSFEEDDDGDHSEEGDD